METHDSIRTRTRKPTAAGQDPQPAHEMDARPASGIASGLPSQEAIAARAYALFLARGGAHGDDWADWLQAEAELRAEGTPAAGQSAPDQGARG
jgi:hypothetical protein